MKNIDFHFRHSYLSTLYPDVSVTDEETSTLAMLEYLNSIPHVSASLLVETGSLTALA
ncbi:MAG: hypothetical protein ACK415_12785 [Thermodesulfovibrionales bacterium]